MNQEQKIARLRLVADGLRRIQEFESARYLDEYAATLKAAQGGGTLSAQQGQGEAVAWIDEFGNVYPLGAHSLNGKLSWQDAHKRSWRPLYTAPPAQPAERVPEGLQSALREAAEVLQMVADSGVNLPPNWRWPLLDELSGYAYMLTMASPEPSEGGKGGVL